MFIPYIGEKSKFSNFIIPNIYVEPFGGMFGIFFCLDMYKFANSSFIYNDINPLNYNLFKNLNQNGFKSKLYDTKPTKELYYHIQSTINNNVYDDIDKAINWLILLCCSRSQYNIIDGEWRGAYEFEVFKLKLEYGYQYIDRITDIRNDSYEDVISIYDSESTFFYLDPPYRTREHFYINHNFNDNSHYELSQIVKGIKGRFALSYYHFPEIDEWYKDYRIIKNKTLMGTELLIMNY